MSGQHEIVVTVRGPADGFPEAVEVMLAPSPGVLGVEVTSRGAGYVTVTVRAWSRRIAYKLVVPQIVKLAGAYPASSTNIEITPLEETAPTP